MFKSNDDIRRTLLEIKKLKDFLDDNIKNPTLKQKVPPALLAELERLKLSLNFFREFNEEFFKKMGLSPEELNRRRKQRVPGINPEAEELYKQADQMKCDLLLSRAKFIKENYKDFLEGNRPFQEVKMSKQGKQAAKKKMKKKFKGMTQRMKWDKL